jgi:hypothetical protein
MDREEVINKVLNDYFDNKLSFYDAVRAVAEIISREVAN